MSAMQSSSIFSRYRRIPRPIVVGAAGASVAAVIGCLLMRQPLALILLVALMPWVPVLLFQSVWKVRRYGLIMLLVVLALLNVISLGGHLLQVVAVQAAHGFYACPAPADSEENARVAMETSLREVSQAATNLPASRVIVPGPDGRPLFTPEGTQLAGSAVCTQLGDSDFANADLIFGVFGLFVTIFLIRLGTRDRFMWIACVVMALMTVEFFYAGFTYAAGTSMSATGQRQAWATVIDQGVVTAIPAGFDTGTLPLYNLQGKFGLFAQHGLLGTIFPSIDPILPNRPMLTLIYNLILLVALVISFIEAMQQSHARYLQQALPGLDPQQVKEFTAKLDPVRYTAGTVIVKQGTRADGFYIISKGQVEIVKENEGETPYAIATLHAGQYFGEVGLRTGSKRTATVRALSDVELLKLDQYEFEDLVSDSAMSREQIDQMINQRLEMVHQHYVSQALPTLGEKDLARVMQQAESESFEPGQVIVKQGDTAEMFYIITAGEVDVVNEEAGGEVISELHEGRYFGEMGLRSGGKRSATVIARSHVEVLKLDHSEFDDLVAIITPQPR
ncbi:MAG: cyclic nucleotide-binding domain-containing protein [Anaerolineae bacterium]